MENQSIVECSGKGINELWIQNDSITAKGVTVEDDIMVNWENRGASPHSISFDKLPEGYLVDGKKSKKLILMKNTSYTISTHYFDAGYYRIRVWTNKDGRVYKTSHSKCSNTPSL